MTDQSCPPNVRREAGDAGQDLREGPGRRCVISIPGSERAYAVLATVTVRVAVPLRSPEAVTVAVSVVFQLKVAFVPE
jgi:hypothetical protein